MGGPGNSTLHWPPPRRLPHGWRWGASLQRASAMVIDGPGPPLGEGILEVGIGFRVLFLFLGYVDRRLVREFHSCGRRGFGFSGSR